MQNQRPPYNQPYNNQQAPTQAQPPRQQAPSPQQVPSAYAPQPPVQRQAYNPGSFQRKPGTFYVRQFGPKTNDYGQTSTSYYIHDNDLQAFVHEVLANPAIAAQGLKLDVVEKAGKFSLRFAAKQPRQQGGQAYAGQSHSQPGASHQGQGPAFQGDDLPF